LSWEKRGRAKPSSEIRGERKAREQGNKTGHFHKNRERKRDVVGGKGKGTLPGRILGEGEEPSSWISWGKGGLLIQLSETETTGGPKERPRRGQRGLVTGSAIEGGEADPRAPFL